MIVEEKADSSLVEGDEIVSIGRDKDKHKLISCDLRPSYFKFDDEDGMIETRFQSSLKELNPNNSISRLSIHKVIASGEKEHFKRKHRKSLMNHPVSEGVSSIGNAYRHN